MSETIRVSDAAVAKYHARFAGSLPVVELMAPLQEIADRAKRTGCRTPNGRDEVWASGGLHFVVRIEGGRRSVVGVVPVLEVIVDVEEDA